MQMLRDYRGAQTPILALVSFPRLRGRGYYDDRLW